jgi:pSer/pThr/pTyr-binding forkhead associated (FHA) protein
LTSSCSAAKPIAARIRSRTFPVAIGRGADVRDSRNQLLRVNHVAFTESEQEINRTVSRRHARIELDEATGRPRLVDDNSAQGTSVIRGGRGIAVPRGSRGLGLKSDDEIVLGQARIKVQVGKPRG